VATDFDTRFASSAWPSMLVKFGETVTHTPVGGGALTPTVVIDREAYGPTFDDDETTIKEAKVTGLTTPGMRDKVTFDSLDWFVAGDIENEAGVWSARVQNRTRAQVAAPGHWGGGG